MTASFDVEILPIAGRRAELRHGQRVLRVVWNNGYAEYYARLEERKLRTAAGTRRPCLCCSTPIISEGPQHRLCPTCRGKA